MLSRLNTRYHCDVHTKDRSRSCSEFLRNGAADTPGTHLLPFSTAFLDNSKPKKSQESFFKQNPRQISSQSCIRVPPSGTHTQTQRFSPWRRKHCFHGRLLPLASALCPSPPAGNAMVKPGNSKGTQFTWTRVPPAMFLCASP